jgi:hypothetical protein
LESSTHPVQSRRQMYAHHPLVTLHSLVGDPGAPFWPLTKSKPSIMIVQAFRT